MSPVEISDAIEAAVGPMEAETRSSLRLALEQLAAALESGFRGRVRYARVAFEEYAEVERRLPLIVYAEADADLVGLERDLAEKVCLPVRRATGFRFPPFVKPSSDAQPASSEEQPGLIYVAAA